FGWPEREGAHDMTSYDSTCPPNNGYVEPIAEYSHGSGCAVAGGYVYRGSAIPALRGTYFYGDYLSGRLWALTFDGSNASPPGEMSDLENGAAISAFGQDGHGEVYIVSLNGSVYRIDPK